MYTVERTTQKTQEAEKLALNVQPRGVWVLKWGQKPERTRLRVKEMWRMETTLKEVWL